MTPDDIYRVFMNIRANPDQPLHIPKLPAPNPDDFYVWRGEDELEAILAEMDGSDTDMAVQLEDAGFGSFGPM